MVGSIVHQLTDGVPACELEKAGLGAYYTDHGVDVYPSSAAGAPFTASYEAVLLRIFFVVSLLRLQISISCIFKDTNFILLYLKILTLNLYFYFCQIRFYLSICSIPVSLYSLCLKTPQIAF